MRRAAAVDRNQAEITAALRAVGCLVHITSGLGGGYPDLMAAYRGRLKLLEVKDGDKSPSRRQLTPAEREFHDAWAEHVAVVETVAQAFAAMGVVTV